MRAASAVDSWGFGAPPAPAASPAEMSSGESGGGGATPRETTAAPRPPAPLTRRVRLTKQTACEREECRLSFVDENLSRFAPSEKTLSASAALSSCTSFAPCQKNGSAGIWENTERRRAPHVGETALFFSNLYVTFAVRIFSHVKRVGGGG